MISPAPALLDARPRREIALVCQLHQSRGGADEFGPRFGESRGCQFRKLADRSIGIKTSYPLSDRKLDITLAVFSGSSLLILFHQQAPQMMIDVRRKSWPRCALSPQFVSALSHAHVSIPHSLDGRRLSEVTVTSDSAVLHVTSTTS